MAVCRLDTGMVAKVVAFGAYDTRKPRVRLLLDALKRQDGLAETIAISGWERVAQTNIPSRWAVTKVLLRMVLAYPGALIRLMRSPKGAAILLPYPGIVEIFLIAPLARLMRRKVVLDAFLPIHDTIVVDRGLRNANGFVAKAIWLFERMGLRLADHIVTDTSEHADYYAREFGIDRERFQTILVGAEGHFTPAASSDLAADILGPVDDRPIVLFYGQLIPLHGVPTIIEAARLCADRRARWVVIGRGQLEPLVKQALADDSNGSFEWIEWVDYNRLPSVIARARICLGVFSASDKAARVIPNKLFQQLAVGKPIITRESPAVETLAADHPNSIWTVPAEDPQALANAVAKALSEGTAMVPLPERQLSELGPDAGVRELLDRLAG